MVIFLNAITDLNSDPFLACVPAAAPSLRSDLHFPKIPITLKGSEANSWTGETWDEALSFCSWAVKPCITEKRLTQRLKRLYGSSQSHVLKFQSGTRQRPRSQPTPVIPHFIHLSGTTVERFLPPRRLCSAACSGLCLALPTSTIQTLRTHSDGMAYVLVLPRWWAEPETLAAWPGLSRSCWRPAGWEDYSGSSPATGSWDAPQTQRSCYLITQMSKVLDFISPRYFHKETKLIFACLCGGYIYYLSICFLFFFALPANVGGSAMRKLKVTQTRHILNESLLCKKKKRCSASCIAAECRHGLIP